METPSSNEDPSGLRALNDPEFFTRWAAVRNQLALAPAGSSGHPEAKRRYDAVVTEYQRRINGGLSDR